MRDRGLAVSRQTSRGGRQHQRQQSRQSGRLHASEEVLVADCSEHLQRNRERQDRHTDRQTDRQTDRDTDKDRQTERVLTTGSSSFIP